MEFMKLILCAAAAAALLCAAETKLGKPLQLKEPVTVAALLAHPDDSLGKTVQVKGKVSEVCQMMGCWMDLTNNDGQRVRIKVDDDVIVFPKDSLGKMAIAEGKLTKQQLTREQAVALAKEEAEESGRKFNPDSIKSGVTFYQIEGTGAVILDK
jgi:hypothetical protein